jgi:hypothetical protein
MIILTGRPRDRPTVSLSQAGHRVPPVGPIAQSPVSARRSEVQRLRGMEINRNDVATFTSDVPMDVAGDTGARLLRRMCT